MTVSSFESPAAQPRIDTYVKRPLDMAMAVVDVKDKQYQAFVDNIGRYSDNIANIKAASAVDNNYLANAKMKLDQTLSDAMAKGADLADPYQASKIMSQVKSVVDPNIIKNIQASTANYAEYTKSRGDLKDKWNKYLDETSGDINTHDSSKGVWQGTPGTKVDIDKLFSQQARAYETKGRIIRDPQTGLFVKGRNDTDFKNAMKGDMSQFLGDQEGINLVKQTRSQYGIPTKKQDPIHGMDDEDIIRSHYGEYIKPYTNWAEPIGDMNADIAKAMKDNKDGDYESYNFLSSLYRDLNANKSLYGKAEANISPKVLSDMFGEGTMNENSFNTTNAPMDDFFGAPADLSNEGSLKLQQNLSVYKDYKTALSKLDDANSTISNTAAIAKKGGPESASLVFTNASYKDALKNKDKYEQDVLSAKQKLKDTGITEEEFSSFKGVKYSPSFNVLKSKALDGAYSETEIVPGTKDKKNTKVISGNIYTKVLKYYKKSDFDKAIEEAKSNEGDTELPNESGVLNDLGARIKTGKDKDATEYVAIPMWYKLSTDPESNRSYSFGNAKGRKLPLSEKAQNHINNISGPGDLELNTASVVNSINKLKDKQDITRHGLLAIKDIQTANNASNIYDKKFTINVGDHQEEVSYEELVKLTDKWMNTSPEVFAKPLNDLIGRGGRLEGFGGSTLKDKIKQYLDKPQQTTFTIGR